MFDTHLIDPHPGAARTYPQKVFCSKNNREAGIVVATWPYSEEGWSDWRVIECSLLSAGAGRCGMDCLSQAKVALE